VKDAAYAAISQARYYGDRKRFSFETYVTIHQDAYEDLEQYGQIVSADKRVRDLLQGIKDPKANAAKETILANNHLRNDFTAAVTHLATSLQLQSSISEGSNRNISGLQGAVGTVADKAVVEAGEIIKEGVQVEADVEDEVST